MFYRAKFPMIAAAAIALIVTGALLLAQEPPPPAAGGRGGRGASGPGRAGAGRAGGAGRSPDKFNQFTRQLASQDVILRGKQLYDAHCASCHAADMRGVLGKGNNLLRSAIAMDDQHGELISARVAKHDPPITLVPTDGVAISEYIHSVLATMGAQGSPPGRNPVGLHLNVLVGDPQAGKAYFDAHCASCHSITGDLKGIGAKYDGDPAGLQNAWVSGSAGFGRGGRGGRGGGGGGRKVTLTMQNGQKVEGTLVREDDFLVVITMPDGSRRDFAIQNGWPKVDEEDPQAAHKKMVLELDDPHNKNMHDVTAYLATLK
ncbi:MAG TPA: c-type cytochrome [Bryobacteraceae bacterium]|nr:c-type cytochrome [Bryobacteraceae bacterium]